MLPSHTCERTGIPTNTERKVHYTSIIGPVLIVTEDKSKDVSHTRKEIQTGNLFYTHTRKDKLTLIPFSVDFTCAHISFQLKRYTNAHTPHRTVHYPFNVLSCG